VPVTLDISDRIEVESTEYVPSDDAVSAMARLLIDLVEKESEEEET